MEEIIQVQEQYYILANSSLADGRTHVLKQGDTFGVFDRYGDIQQVGMGEQGIFHEGTRHLSRLQWRLGRARPLLLSSTIKDDNALFTVDLTNPDIESDGRVAVPRGSFHIFRSKFLWNGVYHECVRICSYASESLDLRFSFQYDADFADIFEVRGMTRARRGKSWTEEADGASVALAYEGLDGAARRTVLSFTPRPASLSGKEALFEVHLPPRGERVFFLSAAFHSGAGVASADDYYGASLEAAYSLKAARADDCQLRTSNERFNAWMKRSIADLHMMVTDTPHGPYPYAGVPWFSTAFGRDGILTAWECLWVNPEVARGVLSFLAATQAGEEDAERDAQPGKILHEMRLGEMAALKEIPFGRYYGTVDATPLFVALAGAYYERTGDLEFVRSLWPNVERALAWIDDHGDADGDGFVEYHRASPKGLVQQGWKDSQDSVMMADGRLAEGPIALCEVQAYVYEAKRRAADLAAALGRSERAERLRAEAGELQERFEKAFWMEDLGCYALALDGEKRPCRVKSSNAGHALFCGIAAPARALAMARTLFADDMFSGWGVRTLASSEVRYNPMSYHNGSIWPHDNAMIAAGLARYNLKSYALKIMSGLFDADMFFDLARLPELFCGFHRRAGEGPTRYPVACSPQAWASGAVFMLLAACLGLRIDAPAGRVTLVSPLLPDFLDRVELRNLAVGTGSLDLVLQRQADDVAVHIARRQGSLKIVTEK